MDDGVYDMYIDILHNKVISVSQHKDTISVVWEEDDVRVEDRFMVDDEGIYFREGIWSTINGS